MSALSAWRGVALAALAVLLLLVPESLGQPEDAVPTLYGATGPAGDTNGPEAEEVMSPGSRIGPWEAILCEGSTLNMRCPTGYELRIEGGFYGRADGMNTCMQNEEDVVSVVGCTTHGAIESITSLCENQEHCSFLITGDVFGNPCTGFQHYLNVSFSCELLAMTQTACDSDYVGLQCYAGQELRIESVAYGRSEPDVCAEDNPDGIDLTLTCDTEDAQQKVSTLCDGREWCYVESSENFFGDPCPTTTKYLEVSYTCAECSNDWGTDADCELWASWGDCENSQMDWMFGYCRKTCTGCHLTETCLNIASDDDCYFWAFIGECANNPDYMNQECRRSCNLCNENYVPPVPEPEATTWAPPVAPAGTMMTTACVNEEAMLSCPAGTHIKIFDTFYGRRDGSVCMAFTYGDTYVCDNGSPDPFLITSYLCNGRQTCSMWSGMPPFQDPCPEVTTTRYLEIDYTCEPCTNAWESNDDCDYWMSWYECEYNRYWMNNQCFRSCSGCNLAENCNNVESDFDCDYWASYGQCEDNYGWMSLNCAKSCRTCYELN